jgi:hypothetical protein
MVPASLIIVLLIVAFLSGSWYFFFTLWNLPGDSIGIHLVTNLPFVLMSSPVALIILTLFTSVAMPHVPWPSWVLFAVTCLLVTFSLRTLWKFVTVQQREARIEAQRRAQGH